MLKTDLLRGETTSLIVPRAFLGFTLVEVMVALAVVAAPLSLEESHRNAARH